MAAPVIALALLIVAMKLLQVFIMRRDRREFPKPKRHIMTYEEITQYWNRLPERWKQQCIVRVIRIRKPDESGKPNIWKIRYGMHFPPDLITTYRIGEKAGLPSQAELPSQDEILQRLGRPGEIADPYTVRIDREWEPMPGVTAKEEVCIANFTLTL